MSTFTAEVIVTLKPEILDVQGRTVKDAVHQLERDEVTAVRCGKYFELQIDADSADEACKIAEEICGKLLANPIIEQSDITIKGN